MKTDALCCIHCETLLGGDMVNTPEPVPCPACQFLLFTRVFPAFFRATPTEEQRQETVSSDEDASCFFHPRKKAVVPCASCGRFLCGLCDLEIDDRHLCPACVEASRNKTGSAKIFLREHTRYDHQALTLALLGVIGYTIPVTAPCAIYYAVRYWNSPKEALIPRGHARQIVAIVLAVVEMVVGGIIGINYWMSHS